MCMEVCRHTPSSQKAASLCHPNCDLSLRRPCALATCGYLLSSLASCGETGAAMASRCTLWVAVVTELFAD